MWAMAMARIQVLGLLANAHASVAPPRPAGVALRSKEFRLLGAGCDAAVTLDAGSSFAEGTRRFALPNGREIGVRETSFGEGKLGYSLWTAGIALATWVCADPSRVRDKAVLELGSGVGLAGFACACAGARSVTLSDMDRVCADDRDSPTGLLSSLRRSVHENALAEAVLVRRIDWREHVRAAAPSPGLGGAASRGGGREPQARALVDDDRFDVVVASDCVYHAELLEPLAVAVQRFLAPDGVAYVMSTHRPACVGEMHASPDDFARELSAAGWCEVHERRCTCRTPYADEEMVLHEVRWRADSKSSFAR
ncbi:hypothetical protein KFE25_008291 [Diacronema lutheri]|uniref:Calmodulin-lysine N-methyltransferase n=1 Tax=Diacronema lutheri TaxID=2081491 RepID=A0A8J6C9V0_DIALT|nr:hypothetical protein KFE25_008291 [Diacronema lutheri]